MPYITFMCHPIADEFHVAGIVDELRAIADAQNVSFYVNVKEEKNPDAEEEAEPEPVVVRDGVAVPPAVVDQLRSIATRAGVTIYVNPVE